MKDNIIQIMNDHSNWERFLEYKISSNHIDCNEQASLRSYIDNRTYLKMIPLISEKNFPNEYATLKYVNKSGTDKKREVYVYSDNICITLKFIAFYLYEYDYIFASNCYAFRKNYGVRHAFERINRLNRSTKTSRKISQKYCYKVDIKNYFNSINTTLLLQKLDFIEDEYLLSIFQNILLEEKVILNGEIVKKEHGAMAGIPVAPFFANVYLMQMDKCFEENKVDYFRYSDDIILFADDELELNKSRKVIFEKLEEHNLIINPQKEKLYKPHEKWEFLGFSFCDGVIDLSDNTKNKMKAKIRHKAKALMRWQRRKKLSPEKAAKGFINSMNRKFFGKEDYDEFTWSRWFFPIINTDKGLKEIDHYMQQYIRYIYTGRHYKGNYRIDYNALKKLGYISLVNEFYTT